MRREYAGRALLPVFILLSAPARRGWACFYGLSYNVQLFPFRDG